MSKRKKEVEFTPEQHKLANKWDYHRHFVGIKHWQQMMLEVRKDANGEDRIIYGEQIGYDSFNRPIYEEFFDIHFKVPLWIVLTHEFLRLELQKRYKDVKNGKEPEEYVFYGKYETIRKYILECVSTKYKDSIKRILTDSFIRNSIRRAAESGFLIVEYDYDVNFHNKEQMINEGKNFRSIRVNHDKIVELSNFNLDPGYKLKEDDNWNKYHRCSREHKWMKKRVISSLAKLNEQLRLKEKKAAFKKKLATLNLKLKNAFDVLKVFVITKQADQFTPYASVHDNLTALKSKKKVLAPPPPDDYDHDDGYYLTEDDIAMLDSIYPSFA